MNSKTTKIRLATLVSRNLDYFTISGVIVLSSILDSKKPSLVLSREVNSNVPYTIVGKRCQSGSSFLWENVSRDASHLKLRVRNIVLKQDPSEVLTLEMDLERSTPIQDQAQLKHYKVSRVEMKFQNNLHEVDTSNYVYEVLCQYQVGAFPAEYAKFASFAYPDEHMFSFAAPRHESTIKKVDKSFSSFYALSSDQLYFYIRRLYRYSREDEAKQFIDFHSLLQKVPTDVELLVGHENIPAHQLVLSYYSDVFKAMFSSKMREKRTGVVRIDDFSVEVMKKMLHFLYTGSIVHVELRYELLKLAHKYQMHGLYHRSKEYILFYSNRKNIAQTLDIADLYNIKPLKVGALNFVKCHKADMSMEVSYHAYLCHTMNSGNVVDTLLFAKEYDIKSVTKEAYKFIKENYSKMKEDKYFSELFEKNPSLIRDMVGYLCENDEPMCISE